MDNLKKRITRIESMLETLLAATAYESPVPLPLRDAAIAANVSLRWLREKVQRKEIAAYRPEPSAPWRVYPRDIKDILIAESNQEPARRQRILKRITK